MKKAFLLVIGALTALAGMLASTTSIYAQGKKLPAALVPSKVHLKLSNASIPQAVAELSAKIGYFIFLDDADGKLKNRTITLDTGAVTYWEAVEKLCNEAKLVEGLPTVSLTPKMPSLPPLPKPGEKIPLIKVGDGTPIFRTVRGVMVLKDGKPPTVTADTATAVRVKPSRQFVTPSTVNELTCGLKVSPEPKLRWHDTLGIRIDRAVDEHGQSLAQVKKVAAPKFGGSFGGGTPIQAENDNVAQVAIRLNKGAKETKTLKELKGVITASVSVFGAELLSVNDIVKSQGKLIKGSKGGSIKVGAVVAEQSGDAQFPLELNLPAAWLPPAKLGAGISASPLPGLKVLDAAGKAIPIVSMAPANAQPGAAVEYVVRVRLAPDQAVTKVAYSSRPLVTVEIPFALKDVAVP